MVPAYRKTDRHEITNQLARSQHPFTGPELACRISERAAKWAIRDWMNRKHPEYGSPHPDKNV
jgi:hypothetical protein